MTDSPELAAVIVLAAGEGTRMRSQTSPKVLHGFAGRSMLGHVLAATRPLGAQGTVVVVGHGRDEVVAHLAEIEPAAVPVVQAEQNGTGHAVGIALPAVALDRGTVVVVPGDTPLLRPQTLAALVELHRGTGAAATLLTSRLADPTGYGRVLREADGAVVRVVEHRDASPAELVVDEVASGVYAFDLAVLRQAIGRLSTDNAQGEQYLPDVVAICVADGLRVSALVTASDETAGVNDRVQLAEAHHAYNHRLLTEHMRAGVTIVDPASTWVEPTVTLEPDATLWPRVELRGATTIAAGASIGPDVTLTDTVVGSGSTITRAVAVQADVGAGVSVGPFAYLRPGTVLHDGVHVGTYVEVKASEVGAGSKVPHLSYVGDATIGEQTNIGAATVFVNYDGVSKHRTVVGDHVKIGSDTMIVAPRVIGDGAYTAAGSVITDDVPPGALAVGRARQRNVQSWVAKMRGGTAADRAAKAAAEREAARPDDTADDGRDGT